MQDIVDVLEAEEKENCDKMVLSGTEQGYVEWILVFKCLHFILYVSYSIVLSILTLNLIQIL